MFIRKWFYVGFASVSLLFFGCGDDSGGLNENIPWYIALGASITNGQIGDEDAVGEGHVSRFHTYLEDDYFATTVEFIDLSVRGATSEEIFQDQVLASVISDKKNLTNDHVISVAAGGNDMLQFMNSPAFADCVDPAKPDLVDCFNSLNSILVAYEDNIDDTFSAIRGFSPEAVLLVRNQFNPLIRGDCKFNFVAGLAHIALNGNAETPITEGLNGILERKAEEYDGIIVDIILPFHEDPETLIGEDCVHPSIAGYDEILEIFIDTIENL